MATRHVSSLEKQALKLSLTGTLVMASGGLVVGFIVNSHAILLDGLFSLLSMGMTGLALYTTHLIHRPDDERFQFGYSHLEPLTTLLQGLVILAICLVAFVSGLRHILQGGNPFRLDFAFIYALFSTVFCFGIYWFEKQIAGKSQSELIRVDSQEWLIDSILSSTLLLGFGVAWLLKRSDYNYLIDFVDPGMTILLALTAAILPIQVIFKNLREVLLVRPDDTNQRLRQTLKDLATEYQLADYSCHFAKSGRQYDLEINILVRDPENWTLQRQDAMREIIFNRLVKQLGKTWLSVSFTTQKKWL